ILEQWLEPVMSAAEVHFKDIGVAEYGMMVFGGILVPVTGWYVARYFYKDKARADQRIAAMQQSTWHKVLFNKYYVDEIYDATVIRPTLALTRALAWFDGHVIDFLVNGAAKLGVAASWLSGQIDKWFVDGAVNGVALAMIAGGRQLRKLQTG